MLGSGGETTVQSGSNADAHAADWFHRDGSVADTDVARQAFNPLGSLEAESLTGFGVTTGRKVTVIGL